MDFSTVFKFNPYHSEKDGRFARRGGHFTAEDAARKTVAANANYPVTPEADALIHEQLTPAEAAEYKKALADATQEVRDGKDTSHLFAKPGEDNSDGKHYTAERLKVHQNILNKILGDPNHAMPAPGEKPTLTMLGGRPGAGKGTFEQATAAKLGLANGIYDKTKNIVVDPDAIKSMLYKVDGNTDLSKAAVYHEESSTIAAHLMKAARAQGRNVVIDKTLRSNQDPILHAYKTAGYKINSHYLAYSPRDSAVSSLARWRGHPDPSTGKMVRGRLAPIHLSLDSAQTEENFDSTRKYADTWTVWHRNADNKVVKLPVKPAKSKR